MVVGAQAIYLRAGDADLVVAPYTTDGDLALDPELLAEIPPLERAQDDGGDAHHLDAFADDLDPVQEPPLGTGYRVPMIPWLPLILACAPCPDGFERSGGACAPATVGEVPPLSRESFQSRYESAGCRELEDCLCDDLETDYLDCDVDCEPMDWSWTDGCAFDLEQAERCLSERWTCSEDGDVWVVEAPESCLLVYDCG